MTTTTTAMPDSERDRVDAMIQRLAWRAQIPQLVLGVLLLVIGVGIVFLAFAVWIRIRSGQLREALRAEPPRVRSVQLHTRKVGPLGITAVTTVFAVIAFDSERGAERTLHLQGKAADLAALVRALEAACPGIRIDDPDTVRVMIV